jgi:hypothetical protein
MKLCQLDNVGTTTTNNIYNTTGTWRDGWRGDYAGAGFWRLRVNELNTPLDVTVQTAVEYENNSTFVCAGWELFRDHPVCTAARLSFTYLRCRLVPELCVSLTATAFIASAAVHRLLPRFLPLPDRDRVSSCSALTSPDLNVTFARAELPPAAPVFVRRFPRCVNCWNIDLRVVQPISTDCSCCRKRAVWDVKANEYEHGLNVYDVNYAIEVWSCKSAKVDVKVGKLVQYDKLVGRVEYSTITSFTDHNFLNFKTICITIFVIIYIIKIKYLAQAYDLLPAFV